MGRGDEWEEEWSGGWERNKGGEESGLGPGVGIRSGGG